MHGLGVCVNFSHTFRFCNSLHVEIIATQPHCQIKHVALCVCCLVFKDLIIDDQTKFVLNLKLVQVLLVREHFSQSGKGASPHIDAMRSEVKFGCLCFCNNFHHLASWCFFLLFVRSWSLLRICCDLFFV
jgi:hypothetical protein